MAVMTKKQIEVNNKRILSLLDELGGKHFREEEIINEGDKLVLPMGMKPRQAIKFLETKIAEDEAMVSFSKQFNYRPWDGAYCMYQVFKRTFGGVVHKGTPGWFGDNPPELRTIPIGVGETTQIPWGRFELPLFPSSSFHMGGTSHAEKGVLFSVAVEARKKDRHRIEGLFKLVEEELKTNSIYRGKAFDGQEMPEFVDVWSVDRSKVVYSQEVMDQIETNVWAQIRHPEACQAIGMPMKRAVLLHGPYGCGKTLACMLTGQEAVTHGVTFIKARPGRDNISAVFQTARLYQPSVVFSEDVDVYTEAETTDRATISRLLDDFDGIEVKGLNILAVFTTNHPEKIHAGMARPGRLDAMIEINELDLEGVRKLVETRIFDHLDSDIDWEAVFLAAEGYKPAFVTEFADRTMRYVIAKHGDTDGHLVGTTELVRAAQGLRPQYDKMMGAADQPIFDPLELATRRVVDQAVATIEEKVGYLYDNA